MSCLLSKYGSTPEIDPNLAYTKLKSYIRISHTCNNIQHGEIRAILTRLSDKHITFLFTPKQIQNTVNTIGS